ncbi:cell wall anchor domain-containing protein, partial [Brochothrix campestris FSL F6-1037]
RIVIANALSKWVYSEPAKVTVKADQTTAELQDVSLYVGQAYDADAPFKRVLNKDGQAINAKDVQYYYVNNVLTKELDTTKPGTHQVRIVIANALGKWVYSEPAKVTVKADQTTAELQDVSLYVGQAYDADAPFKRVLNKDGQAINAKDVQYYYVNNVLTKELDTTKPGTHQVRIVIANALSKWVYSEPAKVTVKADQTTAELQDVSLYVGQAYDADAPFKRVLNKDGQAINAKDVQ